MNRESNNISNIIRQMELSKGRHVFEVEMLFLIDHHL